MTRPWLCAVATLFVVATSLAGPANVTSPYVSDFVFPSDDESETNKATGTQYSDNPFFSRIGRPEENVITNNDAASNNIKNPVNPFLPTSQPPRGSNVPEIKPALNNEQPQDPLSDFQFPSSDDKPAPENIPPFNPFEGVQPQPESSVPENKPDAFGGFQSKPANNIDPFTGFVLPSPDDKPAVNNRPPYNPLDSFLSKPETNAPESQPDPFGGFQTQPESNPQDQFGGFQTPPENNPLDQFAGFQSPPLDDQQGFQTPPESSVPENKPDPNNEQPEDPFAGFQFPAPDYKPESDADETRDQFQGGSYVPSEGSASEEEALQYQCGSGYLIDSNGHCLDIDECRGISNPCKAGYTCINTPGSYNCQKNPQQGVRPAQQPPQVGSPGHQYPLQCNAGYYYDAYQNRCVDINECITGQHNCGPTQDCVNYVGGFTCFCKPGYRVNPATNRCEDIDECREQKNLCLGYCKNTPGSYECGCPNGFVLEKNGGYCNDVNECAIPNMCQGFQNICQNIHGGYRCHKIDCPAGYSKHISHESVTCTRTKTCYSHDHACISSPFNIAHQFITLPHASPIPAGGYRLFTLTYANKIEGSTARFTFNVIRVNGDHGVVPATSNHFSLQISGDSAIVMLNRSLAGPQEIETEIVMSTYDSQGVLFGVSVTKLYVVVSEFGNPVLRP